MISSCSSNYSSYSISSGLISSIGSDLPPQRPLQESDSLDRLKADRWWEGASFTRQRLCSSIMFFCWGDSSRGQLAFPSTGGNGIATPTSVNFNEQLVQIACGEQHTLFLTISGQVLSCGRNSKGQLGRSKSRDTKLPGKHTNTQKAALHIHNDKLTR